MKTYYPSYYDKFTCIAGECPDSCCKAWEIVIDPKTCKKYEAVSGEFGNKLRNALVTDSEGDKCFALCSGKCPFLNGDNLCDIHMNLGEDYTSDVCKAHPRFVEEYDGFTEISLSVSCPEANRIVFSCEDLYPVPEYTGDDEVLALLISSRKSLLDADCSFIELVGHILNTSADDSLDIDMVYIADFPEFNVTFIKDFISVLLKNEILTDEWKSVLLNESIDSVTDEELNAAIKSNEKNLIKFVRYMLYRYYLKAVNDLDVYSRALFIISSAYVSLFVSLLNGKAFGECARLFSKETEHNTDNIDNILAYFSNF